MKMDLLGKLKKRISSRTVKDNVEYYLYMLPVILLIVIFYYVPIFGVIIGFKDYAPGAGFFSDLAPWVGLKHFRSFVQSFYFVRIIRNTLFLNLLGLFMNFWVPIAFALILNEVRFGKIKKTIQTVSYLPHFISNVVVVSMFLGYITDNGLITRFLGSLGVQASSMNTNAQFFPWYYTFMNTWQSFGWSSILYMSTISSIDPALYEAAEVDGARRWTKMWHITLPHMKSLIIIQLIFYIGGMLKANTEKILLFYNESVYSTMDVIGTYVYRDSLLGGRYSYGTAVNLLMSIFGFILTLMANKCSAKLADYSLW